jgi:putative membrane-bound dehydrogenase-like protein
MCLDVYLSFISTSAFMFYRSVIILLITLLAGSCSTEKEAEEHSTESALADLKVYDGLKVALFASEPMFSNPTNLSIDSKGRVWVCEAYNYRNALNPKNPVKAGGDRIMILEDTDGDGKADKSKVFYQGTDVNAALGICVLGNKVFISCSPNVFVFTDENGDDVPDKKEILFTGIQGEQHDHGMHTFTFGHDGRLYFNMGNEAKLLLTAAGDTVTDIHGRKVAAAGKPFREGMALRCEPDGSGVEVLGHNFRNNFELTADPYGTVWQSDNDDDGNKGTRINYVMEQGNYGYTDEMTGAGWGERRTNIEKEIPFRHWHLNDPGVVPNVLQTGAGSPSGITLYEGTMLPEVFRGQIIHAEPGHSVVRAYAIQNDGAGYKATIVNLLEGQKDQWFRPVDVTAAPDGSVFIADWYDPGVGGHQVGDLDRGRIYRVTPPNTSYEISAVDLATPEGAVKALLNPNTDTRYQAWMALKSFGGKAEEALQKLWRAENPRHRAQALWLLARLEDKNDQYLQEALADKDANIRIAALRATRQMKKDVLAAVGRLVDDPSAQVRREAATALRGNDAPSAAEYWAALAQQYDGKDRWYLEALGIGATGNWDQYFTAWKERAGKDWNNAAGKGIIWRSRSKHSIPLLADIIRSSDEKEMLRYFRAFDFHADPSKQQVLAQLATQSKDARVLFALKHMDVTKFKMTPALNATLNKVLDQHKGKLEFVELVTAFKLQNKANDLMAISIQYPDSTSGKEAAETLLNWNRTDLFKKVLDAGNKEESQALIKSLWPHMWNTKTMAVMEGIMMDSAKDIDLRSLAVRTFRGPWEAEDHLLSLAKNNRIPADLQVAAAGVFQTAWRSNIREDGAKYLKLPGSREGVSLPPVSVLAGKQGDASKGKEVFGSLCSNCHRVNQEGVNFGPDLSEIGEKLSKEALYTSILYPDQGISFGYEAYRIKLKNGSTAFGRIVSETEDRIELQYINTQQTVNKADVASKTKMENSLMPSNLQASMSEQDLIDLVAFLQSLKNEKVARN